MTSTTPSRRAMMMGAVVLFQLLILALAGRIALPGCPDRCGDISVPYPFGVGDGCFYKDEEGFNLTCDRAHRHSPPKLSMGDGVEVFNISLPDSTVRIASKLLRSDSAEFNGTWSCPAATGGAFTVSSTLNSFVAYGCNIFAQLGPPERLYYTAGCSALCSGMAGNSSCRPRNHCKADIRLSVPSYSVNFTPLFSTATDSLRHNAIIGAFIVEQSWLSMYGANIYVTALDSSTNGCNRFGLQTVPVVLDWSLKSNWKCIGSNPRNYSALPGVIFVNDHPRIQCVCPDGYTGNPYLTNGCQDIDECQQAPDMFPCHGDKTCINLPGTYKCLSRKSSMSPGLVTGIVICAGFGLVFSLLSVTKTFTKIKKQRAKKLRKTFFKRNHGLLLQQLISSNQDIAEKLKIFSLDELEQATNKFDQNRILGGGGHGTVYKGILSDQRVVAIKKSKIVVQKEIDEFINEVVILSQTNHRNVVKLFGCCLETEVPLLVYEFISNGTLAYHLHGQIENPLSWKDRLRIALETARAIAYLHSAASISVFHRDIKCANILLTDTLTAKVSDFGASRSISIDETGILTAIQGTHGYLDPEYYYTSRLTEKSDVYSFGVILAELLTRIKPVFTSDSSEITSLASYFVAQLRENHFPDILDQQIVEEGGAEDAEVVARLAEACLGLKGEERPTMRQVETRLEDVHASMVNSHINRTGRNLPIFQLCVGIKGEETRQYSLEKEYIESSEIPR